MKKSILLFTSILFISMSISAQDLYLSWEGKTLGETITVWGQPSASEIKFHAIVHNNTGNGIAVKVRRTHIEMVDNTHSQIYWGALFSPAIDESPDYKLILAGEQSGTDDFYGRYIPNSKIGSSIVEYMFFNKDNEDQHVKIAVKYWASPEGIAEEAMKGGSISDIYPNPASQTVNLDYQFTNEVNSAQLKIVNLLGAVVQELVIDPYGNQMTIDIANLDSGIYFYTLFINDDVYRTKKFIVQK